MRQGLGIVVAFSGAVLIIGEPRLSGSLIYVFLVIGGAFTWAIGQVMIKSLGKIGGFKLNSGVALLATPPLYIASFLLEANQFTQIETATPAAWAAVVYLGLVMTALGYAMWYRLLGHYNVNQVMPYLLVAAGHIGAWRYLFSRRNPDNQDRHWRLAGDSRCRYYHDSAKTVS